MSSKLRWTLVAVALAVLVGAGWALVLHERAIGRRDAEIQTLQAQIAAADSVRAHVDTVYRTRVDTLSRWLVRYDTARVRDTITRDSVVYVRRDIVDSTVRACSNVVTACDLRHAADSSALAAMRRQFGLVAKKKPTFWSRLGVYAGYGVVAEPGGTFAHGVELGVGVRVWP